MALTPKQEGFAQDYVATGNASEAYRRNYSANGMKPTTVAVEACKLLDSPNVSQRVSILREALAKRNAITVDDLIKELEEAVRNLREELKERKELVNEQIAVIVDDNSLDLMAKGHSVWIKVDGVKVTLIRDNP